jgi:hypothetical protein
MFSEQPPAAPSLWPSLIGNGWVPSSARCTGRMDARSGEAEDRHPRLTPIGGERSNTPRVASVQAAWKPTPRCCTADSVGRPDPGAHPVELVYLRVPRGTSAAIRCWHGRARTRSRQSTDRSFARDCMEATAPVPARHARAHDVMLADAIRKASPSRTRGSGSEVSCNRRTNPVSRRRSAKLGSATIRQCPHRLVSGRQIRLAVRGRVPNTRSIDGVNQSEVLLDCSEKFGAKTFLICPR